MESNIEKSEDNKNNDNDDCNIYIDRIRHKSVINDIVDSHCNVYNHEASIQTS